MLWNKTYGGANNDCAYAFVQTSDGGYALPGTIGSSAVDTTNFWLVKTDASGNVQWNRIYEGYGRSPALVQTKDGGYVLAGYLAYDRVDSLF